MATAKQPVPAGFHTVTPMLIFEDSGKAIDWYRATLGAEELSRSTGPDGKIMHAEIRIGDSRIMMHDAMMGQKTASAYGGSPASLWVYVENCDTLFNQAVAAGAHVQMPLDDQFWGDRCGGFLDPFGYGWTVATHLEDLTVEEIQARQAEWMKKFAQATAG